MSKPAYCDHGEPYDKPCAGCKNDEAEAWDSWWVNYLNKSESCFDRDILRDCKERLRQAHRARWMNL